MFLYIIHILFETIQQSESDQLVNNLNRLAKEFPIELRSLSLFNEGFFVQNGVNWEQVKEKYWPTFEIEIKNVVEASKLTLRKRVFNSY